MGRKGRPKMPAGGNKNYGAQQGQGRSPDPPSDGSTLFYLYCRTGAGKPWYPVSAMKGDGQSKGLINAWLGAPIAKVRVPTASPPKWRHGPTLVPEERRWQCM